MLPASEGPAAISDVLDSDADTDTIARRTRTKFSLVDVPIDTLEASLPDAEPELTTTETEEDREYQRFLSSLLPTEQENLSFLDEEDEEYKPEEEEDDQEDEETRRGISKKELTDLLLDSTHVAYPMLPTPIAAALPAEPCRDEVLNVDINDEVALPTAGSIDGEISMNNADGVSQLVKMNLTRQMAASTPVMLRDRPGAVTQAQCIQLASQMQKHLQLLLQTYHLLANKSPSPNLASCYAMIKELQQRGENALKCKNVLLSKLQPTMTRNTRSTAGEGVEAKETPSTNMKSEVEPNDGSGSTENLLVLRRVTRSLTAAHAAVAHPSMFELIGSQTLDELLALFVRGCSLEERNRVIQEQMLQLDTHLQCAKNRRKSKKGYTITEDLLLAHGAKRFGTQSNSWELIQKHFLPTKTTQNLRHRYKYLIRPKIPMNVVKALHFTVQPQHHSNSWLLEEDLRIARGFIELHKEKYRFACLAKKYLPHRNRLEVRKRWERLGVKFRSYLANIGLSVPENDSLDLAVAMKEYLEDKLRHRIVRQRGEAEKAKLGAALKLQQLGQGLQGAQAVGNYCSSGFDSAPGVSSLITAAHRKDSDDSCRAKNLHPALFFSSWSFISPSTLLNSTCKHNWPSFMNESAESKDIPQKSHVVDDLQTEVNNPFSKVKNLDSIGSASMQHMMENAVPSDQSEPLTTHVGLAQMPQATLLMDARMARKANEDEDDDSDYEHDELLSSENDESNSDFEQLEFTDDDEIDEDGYENGNGKTLFKQNTPMPDSDGTSDFGANPVCTPFQSPSSSAKSSPRHRPPLYFNNSSHPGNERMSRAPELSELEMTRKSVDRSAWSSANRFQSASSSRSKRKMVSTLVAPLHANVITTCKTIQQDAVARNREGGKQASGPDETLDDIWKEESGDEEFEVVELPSSSDEYGSGEDGQQSVVVFAEDDNEKPKPAFADSTTLRHETTINGTELSPNKKPKLQQCPTCCQSRCICSSSERMHLLLRRMREKRSSSSLQ